jgi:hypothetical protein
VLRTRLNVGLQDVQVLALLQVKQEGLQITQAFVVESS